MRRYSQRVYRRRRLTGDNWFILKDGPANGRDGSLRSALPPAMVSHDGGRYVLTDETFGHRRIYQWEPAS